MRHLEGWTAAEDDGQSVFIDVPGLAEYPIQVRRVKGLTRKDHEAVVALVEAAPDLREALRELIRATSKAAMNAETRLAIERGYRALGLSTKGRTG